MRGKFQTCLKPHLTLNDWRQTKVAGLRVPFWSFEKRRLICSPFSPPRSLSLLKREGFHHHGRYWAELPPISANPWEADQAKVKISLEALQLIRLFLYIYIYFSALRLGALALLIRDRNSSLAGKSTLPSLKASVHFTGNQVGRMSSVHQIISPSLFHPRVLPVLWVPHPGSGCAA